jgi:hypothetical protein
MNNNRRSFIRNAGIAVTAAATGNGAAAGTADTASLQHRLGVLEDTNAIRALQQRCFTLMRDGKVPELVALFSGNAVEVHAAKVLLDARLEHTDIDVAPDRQSATARLHSRVLLGIPLAGDSTLEQMARLQGQTERQWSETGIYTARYVKHGADWKIAQLEFRKA